MKISLNKKPVLQNNIISDHNKVSHNSESNSSRPFYNYKEEQNKIREEEERRNEKRSIIIIFVWSIIYVVISFFTLWKGNKEIFNWVIFGVAIISAILLLLLTLFFKKKIIVFTSLWAVVLCAGILQALYEHILRNYDNFSNNIGELSEKILIVLLISILTDILINTSKNIRRSSEIAEQAADSALKSTENYLNVVQNTQTTAEELKKVILEAKESVGVLRDYTVFKESVETIEESILQPKISDGLANIASTFNKILEPYKKCTNKVEKHMMATLLKTYMNEEKEDISDYKVVTNYGVYSSLVGAIIDLIDPNSANYEKTFDEENKKLVLFTIWNKSPKMWYNFNIKKIEGDSKKNEIFYIHEQFEEYKVKISSIVEKAKKIGSGEKVEIIRYLISSNEDGNYGREFFNKHKIKEFPNAKKNLNSYIYSPNGFGDVSPVNKDQIQNVVENINRYYHNRGDDRPYESFLGNLQEEKFYFWLSENRFNQIKNDNPELYNFKKLGQDFVEKYHTKDNHSLIVKLTDNYLNTYLNSNLSKDFTLFGSSKTNGNSEIEWLFCIGVRTDIDTGVLELDFCGNYANESRFKEYQNIYNDLSSSRLDSNKVLQRELIKNIIN